MVLRLKENLEKLFELCELVAETSGIREKIGLDDSIKMADVLKLDLISFLAYIAASDGIISWNESRYIGELFDVHMTPSKLNKFIIDKNVYSTEFEENTPLMMQLFVAFDNAVYRSPIAQELDEELSDGLFKLYVLLTRGIVEANGRTTDSMEVNEEANVKIYLGMLQRYIDENLDKHHTDIITGYTKNTDKYDEEGGVKAPQKNMGTVKAVKAPKKKA